MRSHRHYLLSFQPLTLRTSLSRTKQRFKWVERGLPRKTLKILLKKAQAGITWYHDPVLSPSSSFQVEEERDRLRAPTANHWDLSRLARLLRNEDPTGLCRNNTRLVHSNRNQASIGWLPLLKPRRGRLKELELSTEWAAKQEQFSKNRPLLSNSTPTDLEVSIH